MRPSRPSRRATASSGRSGPSIVRACRCRARPARCETRSTPFCSSGSKPPGWPMRRSRPRDAVASGLSRPRGPAAFAARAGRLPCRRGARRLRTAGRSPARLAPLRRALGRHWLDLAGYVDTVGFDVDATNILLADGKWRYRDWVIAALNDDKPYDRFIVEQLAGDELYDWRRAAADSRHAQAARGHRLPSHRARPDPRGRRADPAKLLHHHARHARHHGHQPAGADGQMRPLPFAQVRPDSAGGLLPADGHPRAGLQSRRLAAPCCRSIPRFPTARWPILHRPKWPRPRPSIKNSTSKSASCAASSPREPIRSARSWPTPAWPRCPRRFAVTSSRPLKRRPTSAAKSRNTWPARFAKSLEIKPEDVRARRSGDNARSRVRAGGRNRGLPVEPPPLGARFRPCSTSARRRPPICSMRGSRASQGPAGRAGLPACLVERRSNGRAADRRAPWKAPAAAGWRWPVG